MFRPCLPRHGQTPDAQILTLSQNPNKSASAGKNSHESPNFHDGSSQVSTQSPSFCDESSQVRHQSPNFRDGSSHVPDLSPNFRDKSSLVRDQSPDFRDGSSHVRRQSPDFCGESSHVCDQNPNFRDLSPNFQARRLSREGSGFGTQHSETGWRTFRRKKYFAHSSAVMERARRILTGGKTAGYFWV